jgi:hypothetical protein
VIIIQKQKDFVIDVGIAERAPGNPFHIPSVPGTWGYFVLRL